MHTGRCAGFKPAQGHPGSLQLFGQAGGSVLAVRAAVIKGIAHKNAPAQAGARGDHHAFAAVIAVQAGVHTAHMAVLNVQPHDLGLLDVQIRGVLQRLFHVHMILLAVGLHTQTMHSRALAAVQHTALQIGGIGGKAHHAAQSVQLTHQMPLGSAANARVAGHIADKIQTDRKYGGFCAQRGGGVRGLNARMACPHHDHIILSQMIHSGSFFL